MNRRIVATLALAASLAIPAQAQTVKLEFAGRPRLIDCDGRPCFRMEVAAVDSREQPVPIDERAVFSVAENGQPIDVVLSQRYRVVARQSEAAAASQPRKVTLVLFDTSGSMNEKLPSGDRKFEVAKRTLERLFATLQEGVDQMAIAPFDSQGVASRIRGAAFETTRDGLRRQTEALQPRPKGNTALFSAVYEALGVLQPYTREDAQVTLIVFTDGKNDVNHPSDDPGMLAGPEGLAKVTKLASEVGATIYTVGYGAPGLSFDEAALQALKYPAGSSNYFNAQSETRLIQIFTAIANRAGTMVRLLVAPLSDQRREQLSGRSLTFRVTVNRLTALSPAWEGNPLMTPPFEGTLTAAERVAWIKYVRGPGTTSSIWSNPIVVRLSVAVVYSLLLALLWFGLPRLLWPDRYIPKPAFQGAAARAPQRAPSRAPAAPAGGRAPAGRPDVTIGPRAAGPSRPGPAAPQAPPPADRPRPAMPGRPQPPAPAPARPREAWGPREAGDATVFIPPSKKPGGSG